MDYRERELWRRYTQDGDSLARDHLFLAYSGWARSVVAAVVKRLPRLDLDWDDHLQNAHIGLLESMLRFDVERGVDFMAFAKPRVRGAIINGLRKARQMESLDRDEAWAERTESLAADDTVDPLRAILDIVIGTGLAHLLATAGDEMPADTGTSRTQNVLEDVLLELPDRSRDILIAHYYRGVPFQQLAIELNLTKGRISQLHRASLMQLREGLRRRRYERDSFF